MFSSRLHKTLVLALALGVVAVSPAQVQPGDQTLHLTTSVGSMRLIDGRGKVEISFKGTVLISQLQNGSVIPSGNLKKEYDARGRQAYFGQGKLVITGSFRGIQWFGRDLTATWTGLGRARLFGEFDKNLNTGFFWYTHNPKKKSWLTNGIEALLPERVYQAPRAVPRGGG